MQWSPDRAREGIAVRAVIVSRNDEILFRINWFAIESQIHDTLGVRINDFTTRVVLRWLSDVDLVFHTINHVKVVRTEVIPIN